MSDPDIDVIEVLIPGPQGGSLPGIPGSGFSIDLVIDTSSTAAADPGGPGKIRFNNAVQASATELYVDNVDTHNIDLTALLDELGAVVNTKKAILRLVSPIDDSRFVSYRLTGVFTNITGARRLTVVGLASGPTTTPFVNTESVALLATPFGNAGDSTAEAEAAATAAEAARDAALGYRDEAQNIADTFTVDLQAIVDANVDLVNTAALAAAQFATEAADAAGAATTTSATSHTPSIASKVFTIEANKNLPIPQYVFIGSLSAPTTWMHGQVTAYSGTSLTVDVQSIGPLVQAKADWRIVWSSPRGQQGATGSTGATGATGAAGATGSTGASGTPGKDSGLRFNYSNSTAGDPGAGSFRFDNTTFTSAGKVAFSETDGNNNAVAAIIDTLDLSTSSQKALIIMIRQGGNGLFAFLITSNMTDQGSYDEFNITPIQQSGSISSGDEFHMFVAYVGLKGDAGATGAGSGDLLASNNGSDFANKQTAFDNLSLRGADIAAAATVNLDTATGSLVDITGDTGITAFTLSNGRYRMVRFTGNPLITAGANLEIQGAATFQAQPNDFAIVRGYASSLVRFVPLVKPGRVVHKYKYAQGRLTLVSGQPIMITDQSAKTNVYYTPHLGDAISIFNGFVWLTYDFAELTLPLDSNTGHQINQGNANVFDLFIEASTGSPRLVSSHSWATGGGSNIVRGTGASSAELERFQGTWVNKNLSVFRFGTALGDTVSLAARLARFVGTMYMTADGQTSMVVRPTAAAGGTNNVLGLFNAYNRNRVKAVSRDSTASWTVAGTLGPTNASNSNRVTWVDGLAESHVTGRNTQFMFPDAANGNGMFCGVGYDSTSVLSGVVAEFFSNSVNVNNSGTGWTHQFPALGVHFMQALELETGTGTATSYGAQSSPTRQHQGLEVDLDM